jgi:hypothetical protein
MGNGELFTVTSNVSVQFGSYNLGLYQKRTDSSGRPLPPTKLLFPTKDYWTVTLSGIDKDSAGNYLLTGHGRSANVPDHNISFVVDDSTGEVVTWSTY